MNLVPYDPFRHMENWRQEVERWLSEQPFTGAFPALRMPRMDVYETENEVIVSAELPGLEKKDDVQIDVDEDRLTISGSVQRTQEVQGERMHRRERYTGQFQRTVTLPSRVKSDQARATYRNGILEVRIPKDVTPNRRRVDVEFH
ncbi:MAG: heat-shock protein Hsp20 [Thermoactinomycetaceae bacterium]|nr:heat-shock protein Hsp20 [Bacillota bacterium]MBO2532273.1 heat-shock protein Hsp20 [Thermoactinomycetaceae bacterium]